MPLDTASIQPRYSLDKASIQPRYSLDTTLMVSAHACCVHGFACFTLVCMVIRMHACRQFPSCSSKAATETPHFCWIHTTHQNIPHTKTCRTPKHAAHQNILHTKTCRTPKHAAHQNIPHTKTYRTPKHAAHQNMPIEKQTKWFSHDKGVMRVRGTL